jgi:hypothetical protein
VSLCCQSPTGREVIFITEPLAVTQAEPGKRDLPGILVEGNAATLRRPIAPSMDAEEVEMFTAPVARKIPDPTPSFFRSPLRLRP